nr:hypothetical protein [Sedimentibacter sp.]
MKKLVKILLTLLLIVVIIAGALAFWQRDNISALINGMKYSSDDLALQLDTKREELKTQVEKYTSAAINDISAEDEEKLFNGGMTIEEISDKYKLPIDVMKENNDQKTEQSNNPDQNKNVDNTSIEGADNSKAIDDAISVGVSKMYALKAKYVSKLGELEREVINEYSKLPKEKQNAKSKKEIVTKNINYIAEMEQKCDREVETALSTLKKQLKELNGDTEIVSILEEAYENEKELKKAYYLSLYNKK